MTRSSYDPSLYFKLSRGVLVGAITAHVNDLAVVGFPDFVKSFISDIGKRFSIGSNEDLLLFLSISIHPDIPLRTVSLGQSHYISSVVSSFLPPSSTPAISPTNINFKFLSKQSPTSPKSPSQYNQLIGSLLLVFQCTRPNILFAVNKLSQFLQDPSLDHWNAAIRILQYLNATKHFCLTLGGNDLKLVGYSDSDWAEDRDNRRSISGYTFRVGSGAISWKSQKQPTVSLSSSKAKYKALSNSCKEGLWLRNVLCELRLQGDAPVKIFVDNKGAEALAKNPKNHSQTKHINARHHFIRKCVS